MKRIKLETIKKVQGIPFREAVKDDNGEPIWETKKDKDGKVMTQIPRDSKGEAIPNTMAEPIYQPVTRPMGDNTLPELLKNLYLRIPANKLTRQDTVYGARLFQNIEVSANGYLELDDDVHKWLREKLQDDEIGLRIFSIDLYVVEQALDNFERKHKEVNHALSS